jgi:CRISPR-associated protein Cas2
MKPIFQIPAQWWEHTFGGCNNENMGEWDMLTLIAYDISDPRRLARIAKYCEDFGGRVQYSVFELRLSQELFEQFWQGLLKRIDEKTDRVVAYRICRDCARKVYTGGTMTTTQEPPAAYII